VNCSTRRERRSIVSLVHFMRTLTYLEWKKPLDFLVLISLTLHTFVLFCFFVYFDPPRFLHVNIMKGRWVEENGREHNTDTPTNEKKHKGSEEVRCS